MAMAPVVYVLWQEFLRFDPEDPIWPNRDRFILSAGHAFTLVKTSTAFLLSSQKSYDLTRPSRFRVSRAHPEKI